MSIPNARHGESSHHTWVNLIKIITQELNKLPWKKLTENELSAIVASISAAKLDWAPSICIIIKVRKALKNVFQTRDLIETIGTDLKDSEDITILLDLTVNEIAKKILLWLDPDFRSHSLPTVDEEVDIY